MASDLKLKLGDLALEPLILVDLTPQETDRDTRFFVDALRSEDIKIRPFVSIVRKVSCLYQPTVYKRAQAIVGLAEADPEFPRELTLGNRRIRLEKFQELVVKIVQSG